METRKSKKHRHPRSESRRAQILRLPMEPVEEVASLIPASSPALLHLRRTRTEMRDKTKHVVAKRYFSDRTFFIADDASLQVLLETSTHPVFAKSMKRVCFSFATVRTSLEAIRDVELKSLGENRFKGKDFRRTHQQVQATQTAFRNTSSDVYYLRAILANFKDAGSVPALVSDGKDFENDEFQTKTMGYAGFDRQLGDSVGGILAVDVTDHRPFRVLNEVMREIDYPITHLELGWEGFGVPRCPSPSAEISHTRTSKLYA